MKKKLFFLAAAAIALAACSNEEVIEQTRQGKGIDFRASIAQGATSRGVETTQATLYQFYVTAMHGNNNWFSNVLFKNVDNNLYESDEDYLWPGHGSLDFYAWGYNSGTGENNALDPDKYGTVSINSTAQTLEFTPQHEVTDQIDLVTAFQTAGKSDVKENGIGLVFNHALCEIQINAMSNNEDYTFDVRGVAICKVNKTGTLSLSAVPDQTTNTLPGDAWTFANDVDKEDYVVIYDSNIRLIDEYKDISKATNSQVGFIMPIPQSLTAWKHDKDPENSHNGAFLAVLVQIMNINTNIRAFPRPDVADNPGAGDSKDLPGYGWACVPISTTWEPGYRYVYNLDFSYGAGQFDPEDDDQPGEDILGGPIRFNVVVTDWVNAYEKGIGVNMNGHDTTEQSGDTPVAD